MADAYKCDFCGTLTEGKPNALSTEIYSNDAAGFSHSVKFVGRLSVSFKRHKYGEELSSAEVCPPCIRKFAQRIAESK